MRMRMRRRGGGGGGAEVKVETRGESKSQRASEKGMERSKSWAERLRLVALTVSDWTEAADENEENGATQWTNNRRGAMTVSWHPSVAQLSLNVITHFGGSIDTRHLAI